MSRNMTVQAPPPKKNLASKKDIKDVMKRTSYSVSPASMANMSTPSFDGINLIPSPLNFSPPDKKVGKGYGEKVPLPAAAIADGSKSWNAGSSSGNNGASSR